MEETNEISLQEIFMILWNKVWVIILCTLIGGVAAFGISAFVLDPTYTSRVSMYVNSNTERENTIANLNDINASQKLVSTYIEILKSDNVLSKVITETGFTYTPEQIRKMLTASAVNGTEIFEVKITTKDANEAAVIANTIAAVAPEEIIRVVKAGSVELIDEAVPATSPSSPNVLLNTIIGLMLGGVLSVLGVLVAEMLDNRIKNEDDLKKGYDFPILGTIPDLEDAATRIK
ncbi:MAG: Wzz/FepE/Etk N-terminal domain-containing protein [Clostridiales bacterium]|nr:Wzz/FepE/Etk N-terminal domain-containing protein [Clostridiales bacterium]MDU6975027.1 Wzz/FepE/Etk N-terminal domain-containing protein [Clostridiales bacterium]